MNDVPPFAAASLCDKGCASSVEQATRACVRVSGGKGVELGSLLSTLEQLLQVRFIGDWQASADFTAEILLDSDTATDLRPTSSGIASLLLPAAADHVFRGKLGWLDVSFSVDREVPAPFRGRTLTTRATVERFLTVREDERVLARTGQHAIWTISEVRGVKHFRSALMLPAMSSHENFSDLFSGERFLDMLPLIDFIRRIEPAGYGHPPLRAAFIIDDPNLHWPRYGFVDYREVAAHAEKEHYHVAFATIPMDTWFTHSGAAHIFQRGSRRLSLLIHGNDHARGELAIPYSDDARKRLLLQAVRRIERLEAKSGVGVCRVMVPPHGACSSRMLADLPGAGFEAACISAGSLRVHNPGESWVRMLGYAPSEIVHGCPVLPRWGLTGKVENTLLVAAYLGQPMILRGHHDDLKEGLGVLERYARFINGLGDVVWSNLTDLSRLNYLSRREGFVYRVKALGTKIVFTPPSGVTDVVLEGVGTPGEQTWGMQLPNGSWRTVQHGKTFRLGTEVGKKIVLEESHASRPEPMVARGHSLRPRLILRRLLTEARDRLLPTLSVRHSPGRRS